METTTKCLTKNSYNKNIENNYSYNTPTNTTHDDQFVTHDISDSTNDDVNITQENINIGIYPLFIFIFIVFLPSSNK